jgi:hypothetical protein
MKFLSGKLFAVAGVALAITGLLAFSVMAPGSTVGLETDVEPPPSYPDAVTIQIAADHVAPVVGETVSISVDVQGANGDPVAGELCTFSIASQPGTDASVDAGPVTTDANGGASTTLNVGSTAGTIEVAAQCGDVSASVSVVASAAEAPAQPPASLPNSGSGGYLNQTGPARVLLISLLGALGVTLAGGGIMAARQRRRLGRG